MKINQIQIQGLDCIHVDPEEPGTAVIMLHGYGANMQDLFPLWELWNQEGFHWYFPNGTLSLPMGYYESRAWFSIDIEKLERAMRLGEDRELAKTIPPEFDQTIMQLEQFVSELSKRHETIILGGFSQGGMCAYHLALKPHLNVQALILFSTGLIAQKNLPNHAVGIPFYQSHGEQDPILAFAGAQELYQKLESLNLKGKFRSFRGGHEIPASVITEVKIFLSQF